MSALIFSYYESDLANDDPIHIAALNRRLDTLSRGTTVDTERGLLYRRKLVLPDHAGLFAEQQADFAEQACQIASILLREILPLAYNRRKALRVEFDAQPMPIATVVISDPLHPEILRWSHHCPTWFSEALDSLRYIDVPSPQTAPIEEEETEAHEGHLTADAIRRTLGTSGATASVKNVVESRTRESRERLNVRLDTDEPDPAVMAGEVTRAFLSNSPRPLRPPEAAHTASRPAPSRVRTVTQVYQPEPETSDDVTPPAV